MIGHFFQKTLYIKMTFILEYACQREIPARAQSDFMLFLSAYVRHPKKGLRDLTSQWPPTQAGSADRRTAITGPLLCLLFLQKLIMQM